MCRTYPGSASRTCGPSVVRTCGEVNDVKQKKVMPSVVMVLVLDSRPTSLEDGGGVGGTCSSLDEREVLELHQDHHVAVLRHGFELAAHLLARLWPRTRVHVRACARVRVRGAPTKRRRAQGGCAWRSPFGSAVRSFTRAQATRARRAGWLNGMAQCRATRKPRRLPWGRRAAPHLDPFLGGARPHHLGLVLPPKHGEPVPERLLDEAARAGLVRVVLEPRCANRVFGGQGRVVGACGSGQANRAAAATRCWPRRRAHDASSSAVTMKEGQAHERFIRGTETKERERERERERETGRSDGTARLPRMQPQA